MFKRDAITARLRAQRSSKTPPIHDLVIFLVATLQRARTTSAEKNVFHAVLSVNTNGELSNRFEKVVRKVIEKDHLYLI